MQITASVAIVLINLRAKPITCCKNKGIMKNEGLMIPPWCVRFSRLDRLQAARCVKILQIKAAMRDPILPENKGR
jgi:hypothetical protein